MNRFTNPSHGGVRSFRWPDEDELIGMIARLAAYEDTGLTPEEVSEVARAKRESCDTCRQKQDGGSWLFNVYPCRECRNRTKSHYEAAEAALGEGDGKNG